MKLNKLTIAQRLGLLASLLLLAMLLIGLRGLAVNGESDEQTPSMMASEKLLAGALTTWWLVRSITRPLAQRSASAARDIRNLIDTSVNRIAEGNAQVQNAGSAMEEILRRVQRVNERVETLSHASREQSTGIDQVNVAVTHRDAATQQNATLSQESSSAAQAMHRQVGTLLETVSVFKLREVV
jgi:methyl-accepting chemotaxis sensory transducer